MLHIWCGVGFAKIAAVQTTESDLKKATVVPHYKVSTDLRYETLFGKLDFKNTVLFYKGNSKQCLIRGIVR